MTDSANNTEELLSLLDGMENALGEVLNAPAPSLTAVESPGGEAGISPSSEFEVPAPSRVMIVDRRDPFEALRTEHPDQPPPLRLSPAAQGTTAEIFAAFGWGDES